MNNLKSSIVIAVALIVSSMTLSYSIGKLGDDIIDAGIHSRQISLQHASNRGPLRILLDGTSTTQIQTPFAAVGQQLKELETAKAGGPGRSDSTALRDAIILGAEGIVDGPDFPHRPGSAGSSVGDHHFFRGSFLVSLDDYRAEIHPEANLETFLWDVFSSYGSFIRQNIDFNAIPGLIAKGGDNPEPRAKRYDWFFVAKDIGVMFDVEWFRGGPRFPDEPNPSVQIRYHIRIN